MNSKQSTSVRLTPALHGEVVGAPAPWGHGAPPWWAWIGPHANISTMAKTASGKSADDARHTVDHE